MLCNLILSLTTQPATVRKNTGLRKQFALGGPFVQPASSACFRRFFSAAISAISRANFSLHTASVWTETLVPFVSRSLSGSREARTLQFPEEPLVQGSHVVVHCASPPFQQHTIPEPLCNIHPLFETFSERFLGCGEVFIFVLACQILIRLHRLCASEALVYGARHTLTVGA